MCIETPDVGLNPREEENQRLIATDRSEQEKGMYQLHMRIDRSRASVKKSERKKRKIKKVNNWKGYARISPT